MKVMIVDVIIIGAGLAGLSCAATLKKESPLLRILIVEARSRIGGRVYSSTLLTPHQSVDLGAEFIQGEHSLVQQLGIQTDPLHLRNHNSFSLRTISGKGGYYYLGYEAKLLPSTSNDQDIIHLHDTIRNIKSESIPHTKVLDYLLKHGVSNRVIGLVHDSSTTTLCNEVQKDFDPQIYRVSSYISLLAKLRTGIEIWTEWPVKEIEWKTNCVRLISEKNEIMVARTIVFTPSVSVVKSGIITFSPPLPYRKSKSYKLTRMEPCIKIALVFHTRFVPDDFQGIICANCPVPEFWDSSSSTNEFVLMAYATSSSAVLLSRLSMLELQHTILRQLDRMFRKDCFDTPATNSYCNMMVQDWTKDKYIGGCYSSPVFSLGEKERNDMALPMNHTIYFAGEATSATRYMTVQGAMESGSRAAYEIIRDHTRNKSKL